MKDYIRRNETDVPAIWWIQHGVGEGEQGAGPVHRIDQYDKMASWLLVSTLYVRLRWNGPMSSSHKVCFSLLFKNDTINLIPSNRRKSAVVNGDKRYTIYKFSYNQMWVYFDALTKSTRYDYYIQMQYIKDNWFKPNQNNLALEDLFIQITS